MVKQGRTEAMFGTGNYPEITFMMARLRDFVPTNYPLRRICI